MSNKEEFKLSYFTNDSTLTKASKIKDIFNLYHIEKQTNINKNLVLYNNEIFFKENVDNKEQITKIVSNVYSINQQEYNFNREKILKINQDSGICNLERLKNVGISKENNELNFIEQIFIPCINCNNLISLNDTEKHSIKCVKVQEEVLKLESSIHSYYLIDHRLKKLGEHIREMMKISNKIDTEILTSILKDIETAIEYQVISYNGIVSLKKLLSSLKENMLNFKGSMSTLILVERAKVIISQKLNVFREDLKKKYDTEKFNRTNLGSIQETTDQDKEMTHSIKYLEKQSTSSNTAKSNERNSYHSMNNSKIKFNSRENLSPHKLLSDDASDDEKVTIKNQLVEINSEVEQNPYKTELSDGTSFNTLTSYCSESNQIRDEKRLTSKPCLTNFNEDYNSEENEEHKCVNSTNNQKNGNYRDFVKLFLKIKFEKLDNDHCGQKISQDAIWQQALQMKVPCHKWKQFILSELKNYKKYNDQKKKKKYEIMDVIDEEN